MRYQPGDLEARMEQMRRAYAARWNRPHWWVTPPIFDDEDRRQTFQAHLDLETSDQIRAYRVLRHESVLDAFPDEFLPSHEGQTYQQFKTGLSVRRRNRHHPLATH